MSHDNSSESVIPPVEKPRSQITIDKRGFLGGAARIGGALFSSWLLGRFIKTNTASADSGSGGGGNSAPDTLPNWHNLGGQVAENANQVDPNKDPKVLEKIQAKTIEGLKVYGSEQALNVTELDVLQNQLDEQFWQDYKTRFGIDVPPSQRDEFKWYAKERSLDKSKRYLQIYVDQDLYQKLASGQDLNGTHNFASWMGYQMEELNRVIKATNKDVNLEGVISRIIVVDKQTAEKLNGLGPSYQRLACDSDGVWPTLFTDTRNRQEDPTKESRKRKITITKNGKEVEVTLDDSMIHEWFHRLFDTLDEYTTDFLTRIPADLNLPIFMIDGDYGPKRDQFIALWLNYVTKNNLRDAHLMEGGQVRQTRGYADKLQAKVPTTNSIDFAINGKELNTAKIKLLVGRNEGKSEWGGTYATKTFQPVLETQTNGAMRLPKECTALYSSTYYQDIPTTNLYFQIETPDRKSYFLHLPIYALNMEYLLGSQNANLTINFNNPLGIDQQEIGKCQQTLRILNRQEFNDFLAKNPHYIYAWLELSDKQSYFVWENFRPEVETSPMRDPNRPSHNIPANSQMPPPSNANEDK